MDTPAASPASGLVRDSIVRAVGATRRKFEHGVSRPLAWRDEQLRRLAEFIRAEEDAINAALDSDLGRSRGETYLLERWPLLHEITHTRKRLRKWAAPRRVPTPLALEPGSGFIRPEPLGVALIISPWNYPIYLSLAPLICAMAAGNCAVLKPSELSSASSRLLAERLGRYLDPECFRVIEGAVPETTTLLEQRFDHIFYTGGARVARIVMSAAARNLTPITLELGGKSPCIVHESANLEVAAKRIVWGKFLNAGQTCVAPDYILATDDCHDALVDGLGSAIEEFYGDDPQGHAEYSRLVNDGHFERVASLIDASKVVHGGQVDGADKYIAPTVMTNVSLDDPVMQEEIFGPVLPVVRVRDVDHAVQIVNGRDKPLAMYFFGNDRRAEEHVLDTTSAGGVTVNHTILHLANGNMPFGGVGESGMGAYHGKWGFDTFSHLKPVFRKPTWIDPPVLYAPFQAWKMRFLRWLE